MIKASVIIPTYKRKKSVIKLLKSLHSEIDRSIEIIICEQGENNKKIFSKSLLKKSNKLKYFHVRKLGTSVAKNFAAKKAKGQYLIFFDDDVIVKKNIINNYISTFETNSVGAIGGRVITPGQKNINKFGKVGKISFFGKFSDSFSSINRVEIDTVIGCNCAWRKSVFFDIGGFDEQFTGAFREDSDLSLRTINYGEKILFEPKALVYHLRYPTGGGRKSEGRLGWYFNFFSNETYFFLKHRPKVILPIILATRFEWFLKCMFGFGREVSLRSILTPWTGVFDGIKKYKNHENRN